MKKILVAVAAISLMSAGQARAQSWDDVLSYVNYCTSGALYSACGSVVVKTRDNGFGTDVQLRVRNLQGSSTADNTGGSFLTMVGLTAPNIDDASNLSVTTDGPVAEVRDPDDDWVIKDQPIGGQVEFSMGTTKGKQGAIQGCDDPNGATRDYFITCDANGNTGWVVFSFTTTNDWTAGDAQVALKYQSVGAQGISVECRTGETTGDNACTTPGTPPTVVPEPSTYVLLLTGLLGISWVGWKRKEAEQSA